MRQQEFRRRKRKPRKSARSEIVFGARDWHHIFTNIQLDIFNGSVIFPLYGCKTEIFERFNGNFRLLHKSQKTLFIYGKHICARQNISVLPPRPASRY